MMTVNDLEPEDLKYVVDKPSHDFNPARNKAVIEETMREADAFHNPKKQFIEDALGERIEAVAAYGVYRLGGKGFKDIKGYLGDRIYKQLVGEELIERIKAAQTLNRLNGNTKFPNAVLL